MLHVMPDLWGTLLERGLRFVQRLGTGNLLRSEIPFMYGQMESSNTSPQAVKLNLSCSEQAHYNRPGIGPGYENKQPGCLRVVLYVPSH